MFAYAAAQVTHAMEATHRLGGADYVLWGGREGYETLLNTDLRHEADQLARFLTPVAEHKHRIGFEGTLLIEPKPQEPTEHQYDYDAQSVHGFLERYDLVDEFKVNLEVNHATLAGHSFHHEVTYAAANGILSGEEDLASLEARVAAGDIDPAPVSGRQEELENRVNQVIRSVD